VRHLRQRRFILRAACILLFLQLCLIVGHARFKQPNDEYQGRRTGLRSSVDGPVVIFGYTGHEDSSEVAIFFQEENFYYLSGYDYPGAALVLIPDLPEKPHEGPHEILYIPPHNRGEEKWEGTKPSPGDPDILTKTGFEAVKPFANLRGDLAELAKTYSNFYTELPPKHEEGYPHLTIWNKWLRDAVPQAEVQDVTKTLSPMRLIKSQGELDLMQKAIDASIDAHFDAMKHMRPGMFEYQIAARMKEIHELAGCSREAYAPIVGSGFNSTVLHYSRLNDQIKAGDIVVMDVGGEYGGYAADITRTLPATGKFTARQREIYEIVLEAQNAALAAVKPGARLYDGPGNLQEIVTNYFNSHGHDKQGKPLGKYYIHGVSHYLGLNVHDVGDRDRPLEAGMVITVEPGLYIPEENIGVRIEDDVLVTKDGYQILTARLPRTVEEIEKIMAEGRKEEKKHPQKTD